MIAFIVVAYISSSPSLPKLSPNESVMDPIVKSLGSIWTLGLLLQDTLSGDILSPLCFTIWIGEVNHSSR